MSKAQETAQAVEAGMELVGWKYNLAEWHAHIDQEKQRLRHGATVIRRYFFMGGIFVVGGLLLIPRIGFWSWVLLVALLLLVYVVFSGRGARGARELDNLRDSPPRVLLTSTGITFGDQPHLWRHERGRLEHVEIVHGKPSYLVLRFARKLRGSRALRIPIPPGLKSDVIDLAKMLENKVPSRD